jgi:hypothetical protein
MQGCSHDSSMSETSTVESPTSTRLGRVVIRLLVPGYLLASTVALVVAGLVSARFSTTFVSWFFHAGQPAKN